MKIPVCKVNDDYVIYYELYEDRIWTHADVYKKWTPSIAKEFYNVHYLLHELAGQPFYCLVDNTKLEKFVRGIGYKYVQDAMCIDGVTRRIYRYG